VCKRESKINKERDRETSKEGERGGKGECVRSERERESRRESVCQIRERESVCVCMKERQR
jgi:hypothetical protein